MDTTIALNKNLLVSKLGKNPREFTKADIIRFVEENGIEMVNFMYPAADGRLKTLNFIITDRQYLDTILSYGERVDGSSLFPFIEAGNSDLYVVPRYSTAFVDPFAAIPTVAMLCSFFDKEGQPLDLAPEQTLRKACRELTALTGLRLEAMGELEFYVVTDDSGRFPLEDQRGYHASAPFAKTGEFRARCMQRIAQTGGRIKYGHSEVGCFALDGKIYEQNEIEFIPVDAPDAADQLMLAKWAIRCQALIDGVDVTFAPKITTGKAGSGLHIHMRLVDAEGNSRMLDSDRRLSDTARRAIAGLIDLAPALTAFGNTNPTSYFRLVPHQEAPTLICWGDRNRSVLVRVPLGWTAGGSMAAQLNGDQNTDSNASGSTDRQTVEIRNADGSADIYRLIAGIAVAVRHGFEMPDALKVAEDTYVDINIHKSDAEATRRASTLAALPADTSQSAAALEKLRKHFEDRGVFSSATIDHILATLRAYDVDEAHRALADTTLMSRLVARHYHCG